MFHGVNAVVPDPGPSPLGVDEFLGEAGPVGGQRSSGKQRVVVRLGELVRRGSQISSVLCGFSVVSSVEGHVIILAVFGQTGNISLFLHDVATDVCKLLWWRNVPELIDAEPFVKVVPLLPRFGVHRRRRR